MKLIVDENLPPSWVQFLDSYGHQSRHWKQIGTLGDSDEIIFDYAKVNGCVILSQDLDFTRMLALSGGNLPSVIQLRIDSPIPERIGTLLFGFKIYFDFCGYSLIALGLGRILGIELTLNFRSPYLSTNIRDFWRRWHVSLSYWFRDYVYIPLGGSKTGRRITHHASSRRSLPLWFPD